MTRPMHQLPPDITVLERGWLSSNNILIQGSHTTALVDSGYATHAPQTVALVRAALGQRPLNLLVNTHLHSDHCGGNAALQAAWPALRTAIPPGLARHVRDWDAEALTYAPTGQSCPPFTYDTLLEPGTDIRLGDRLWQVHAAPGHDTHSVILFDPAERILISADALWERGFGVVFPELEGDDAFDELGETIDLIESLAPALVIPGHGRLFTDVPEAIAFARTRLQGFVADPARHTRHAAKVLLKFRLLEVQRQPLADFVAWAVATPYFAVMARSQGPGADLAVWLGELVAELVRAGAVAVDDGVIVNVG
jgi:glyoxylase-like metal-dependent hydrolase (beta-lactamase superfamily II)